MAFKAAQDLPEKPVHDCNQLFEKYLVVLTISYLEA